MFFWRGGGGTFENSLVWQGICTPFSCIKILVIKVFFLIHNVLFVHYYKTNNFADCSIIIDGFRAVIGGKGVGEGLTSP